MNVVGFTAAHDGRPGQSLNKLDRILESNESYTAFREFRGGRRQRRHDRIARLVSEMVQMRMAFHRPHNTQRTFAGIRAGWLVCVAGAFCQAGLLCASGMRRNGDPAIGESPAKRIADQRDIMDTSA